jgi:hypothetical protein
MEVYWDHKSEKLFGQHQTKPHHLMILDQMSQCLWQCSRMWSTDSASTRQIGQFDSELPNIPLRTNIQRVLILLMIPIEQKISTLGGTIPFQIPANEKALFFVLFTLVP